MQIKKKRRGSRNRQFQSAAQSSFQAQINSQQNIDQVGQKGLKVKAAQQYQKSLQQQTAGGQSLSNASLPRPYQFLKFASPPLHMIFFPNFTLKSINFILTIILTFLFGVLLVFNYVKEQNDFTWNCSLYQLQNKFFPKLRYKYQIWRVIVSAFFHSNIAHFLLNVFGLQVYGYFVENYYGKFKYILALFLSAVGSHFFAASVDNQSVSTMASSLLFCAIALKIWFLYEYRNYKGLDHRRILIYLLLVLITCINLIPIFVVNNVDFSSHIGGLVTGGLIGAYFHLTKQQQLIETDQERSEYPKLWKAARFASLIAIAIFIFVCVIIVFTTDSDTLYAMSYKIDDKCK